MPAWTTHSSRWLSQPWHASLCSWRFETTKFRIFCSFLCYSERSGSPFFRQWWRTLAAVLFWRSCNLGSDDDLWNRSDLDDVLFLCSDLTRKMDLSTLRILVFLVSMSRQRRLWRRLLAILNLTSIPVTKNAAKIHNQQSHAQSVTWRVKFYSVHSVTWRVKFYSVLVAVLTSRKRTSAVCLALCFRHDSMFQRGKETETAFGRKFFIIR